MAFLIKDNDKLFVGSFGETSENQFTFLATNCEKFFIENLSAETLLERTEEINDSIRYKQSKVIKTIQEEAPMSSVISNQGEALQINLKFDVNNRPLNIYFKLAECDIKDVGALFTVGLFKLAIENSLMMGKLYKAVEAKDVEIEEYKRNGATLVRESLATKRFNFEEELLSSKVQLVNDQFSINISPLLNESNIPDLCSLIQAENVLGAKKKNVGQGIESQRNTQLKARNASRIPVAPKPLERKPLEYVNDDGVDVDEAKETQTAKVPKKPRLIKKPNVNF